jgi:hypothetical protein
VIGVNGRPIAGMLPPVSPPAGVRTGGRARGRFAEINGFIDVTLAELTRAEAAVWLVLWRDTKPNGLARTSQTDLARRAGCDTRTVRRALDRLTATGLVKIVRVGRINVGPTVYRVRGVNPAGPRIGGQGRLVEDGHFPSATADAGVRHPRRDQKRQPAGAAAAEPNGG